MRRELITQDRRGNYLRPPVLGHRQSRINSTLIRLADITAGDMWVGTYDGRRIRQIRLGHTACSPSSGTSQAHEARICLPGCRPPPRCRSASCIPILRRSAIQGTIVKRLRRLRNGSLRTVGRRLRRSRTPVPSTDGWRHRSNLFGWAYASADATTADGHGSSPIRSLGVLHVRGRPRPRPRLAPARLPGRLRFDHDKGFPSFAFCLGSRSRFASARAASGEQPSRCPSAA